jgi:hypothetical protein
MRGIADGASDAGAKWQGRRLDVVDIVVANVTVELGELRGAMAVTPTGLETSSSTRPPTTTRSAIPSSTIAAPLPPPAPPPAMARW